MTPFPNRLLDDAMPELRDTEWRLLCVVVRQTLGWQVETGGRKERDWITHTQLKARTGRAGAAVSAALDRLVRFGLLEVSDARGTLMPSPAERRRSYRKLYFRLHPAWLGQSAEPPGDDRPTRQSSSENENQKAKTTKETGTKIEIPQESSQSENGLGRMGNSQDRPKSPSPGNRDGGAPGRTDGADEADAAHVVTLYKDLYLKRFGEPAAVADSELEALPAALVRYGTEALRRYLPAFFESDFGYVRRRGYSLASYLETIAILRAARSFTPNARTGATPLPRKDMGDETKVETHI